MIREIRLLFCFFFLLLSGTLPFNASRICPCYVSVMFVAAPVMLMFEMMIILLSLMPTLGPCPLMTPFNADDAGPQ